MSATTRTEHPILFTGEMVRAILDGHKTQTRRVVTSRNALFDGHKGIKGHVWGELDWTDAFIDGGPSPAGNAGPYLKVARPAMETRHRIYPKVKPGDLLWVRETWLLLDSDHTYSDRLTGKDTRISYRADTDADGDEIRKEYGYKWKPSIFMPKSACRIWLEVTGVRVQRVQDISEDDIKTERSWGTTGPYGMFRRAYFQGLWDSINEKRGYGWRVNPWVWVYEFKRATREAT